MRLRVCMQYLDYSYSKKDAAFHRAKMRSLAAFVPAGATVLDLGSLHGELGAALVRRDVTYCGLDNDADLVASCVSRGLNVKLCDIGVDKIPFKQKFDYVFALDVLEHVHNPYVAVEKLSSVLKENGKLIISLPNDFHLLNRLRFAVGSAIYPNPFSPYTHLHTFTVAQAKKFLRKNKLRVVKTDVYPGTFPSFVSYNFRRWVARLWPAVLGRGTVYVCEVLR